MSVLRHVGVAQRPSGQLPIMNLSNITKPMRVAETKSSLSDFLGEQNGDIWK